MKTVSIQKDLQRMQRWVKLLDQSFTIPYIHKEAGWDFIIGLVPVVGDVVTFLFSIYLFFYCLAASIINVYKNKDDRQFACGFYWWVCTPLGGLF